MQPHSTFRDELSRKIADLRRRAQEQSELVDLPLWRPEPGDELAGVVLETSTVGVGPDKRQVGRFIVEDAEGERHALLASSRILADELSGQDVRVGSVIFVRFEGEAQTQDGARSFKKWSVAVDPPDVNPDDDPPF